MKGRNNGVRPGKPEIRFLLSSTSGTRFNVQKLTISTSPTSVWDRDPTRGRPSLVREGPPDEGFKRWTGTSTSGRSGVGDSGVRHGPGPDLRPLFPRFWSRNGWVSGGTPPSSVCKLVFCNPPKVESRSHLPRIFTTLHQCIQTQVQNRDGG